MDRHDIELKKVVIKDDDITNIVAFFEYFNIPLDSLIKEKVDGFKNDPAAFSFNDQTILRMGLARALSTTDHPLINSEVFKNIREKCTKVWYEAQFDSDIEEMLTTHDKNK